MHNSATNDYPDTCTCVVCAHARFASKESTTHTHAFSRPRCFTLFLTIKNTIESTMICSTVRPTTRHESDRKVSSPYHKSPLPSIQR